MARIGLFEGHYNTMCSIRLLPHHLIEHVIHDRMSAKTIDDLLRKNT